MNRSTPKRASITVVIPTYNGATFIRAALESVLSQTLQPSEIVVIDDASSDNTVDVANDVAIASSVPICVTRFAANTGGPAGPINAGVKAATGELIAVLEQDDVMEPTKLCRQAECLARFGNASICISRVNVVSDHPDALPDHLREPHLPSVAAFAAPDGIDFEVPGSVAYPCALEHNFAISNSNFMFRKDIWKAAGGFDRRFKTLCDKAFFLRTLRYGSLAIANEHLLNYHFRPGSLNRQNQERTTWEWMISTIEASSSCSEWAGSAFWEPYWTLRQVGWASLKRGQVMKAADVARELFATGALRYHLGCQLKRLVRP